MKALHCILLLFLTTSGLQAQYDSSFYSGFWLEANDLNRLKNRVTKSSFCSDYPFFFYRTLFLKTTYRKGIPHLNGGYVWDYDMIFEKDTWRLKTAHKSDWHLKFLIMNQDTFAIISDKYLDSEITKFKIYQKIPPNVDSQEGSTLSDNYWSYTKYLISGRYEAIQESQDMCIENVRFTKDLKIFNFRDYTSFRLVLRNSKPVLGLRDRAGNMTYFILEGTKNGFDLFSAKNPKRMTGNQMSLHKKTKIWRFIKN